MTASAVKNGYLKLPWISASQPIDEPAVSQQETTDAIPLFDENDLVQKAQAGDAAARDRDRDADMAHLVRLLQHLFY